MKVVQGLSPKGATLMAIEPFDYSALPENAAAHARAVAERIRERNKAAILETGRDLAAIKEKLGHGHFLPWIEAEFGMNERTAQRYMNAAAEFGDKSDIVSLLPATAIYELAAPSTPAAIRAEVVKRIEAGERPAPETVITLVKEGRHKARQEKEVERRKAALARMSEDQRAAFLAKEKRAGRSRERRQAEADQQRAEYEARRIREREAASRAASMIANALGDQFPQFLALYSQASWAFGKALEEFSAEKG